MIVSVGPYTLYSLALRRLLEPRDNLGRQGLAAAHDGAQGEAFVESGLLDQKPEKRWHAMEN